MKGCLLPAPRYHSLPILHLVLRYRSIQIGHPNAPEYARILDDWLDQSQAYSASSIIQPQFDVENLLSSLDIGIQIHYFDMYSRRLQGSEQLIQGLLSTNNDA